MSMKENGKFQLYSNHHKMAPRLHRCIPTEHSINIQYD